MSTAEIGLPRLAPPVAALSVRLTVSVPSGRASSTPAPMVT